jgi:hypothetical protein
MVTATSGRAAPVWSVTTPERLAPVWAHAGNAPIAIHKSSKRAWASSEAAVGTEPARVKVFQRLPYRTRICERSERFTMDHLS